MKKSVLMLFVLFAFSLCGCGDPSKSLSTIPETSSNTGALVSATPSVSSVEDSQEKEISSVSLNVPEVSVCVDTVNAFEPMPPIKDVWEIHSYTDHVPFTPDGYDGRVVDYVTKRINSNGQVSTVTYKDVAYFTFNDDAYYVLRDEYWFDHVDIEVNGETVYGGVFLYKNEDYATFLEHYHDGVVERFLLNVDLPGQSYVLAQSDSKAIMVSGPSVFTYNFETAQTNLISDAVLDYKYPVEGEFYFTDWDHIEYTVDWEHDDVITITGNQVAAYHNEDFSLSIMDDFEEEFLKIQQDCKKDTTKNQYTDKYTIYNFGSVYSTSKHKLVTSIHLPHAYLYNSNLMSRSIFSCWLLEELSVNLYRYGDLIRSYELPDGNWRIISSSIDLHRDANSSHVEYILDANGDGVITPREFNNAITYVNILLMNTDDSSIYTINNNGVCQKVLSGVVDYREVYGKLYWMDASRNGYLYDWLGDETNELIETNVVGVSPFTDEGAGFLVKPDDSSDYVLREGFPLMGSLRNCF